MKNEIGTVIHCAALARLSICHKKPNKAIETNIIGTSNIINGVLRVEEKFKKAQETSDNSIQNMSPVLDLQS